MFLRRPTIGSPRSRALEMRGWSPRNLSPSWWFDFADFPSLSSSPWLALPDRLNVVTNKGSLGASATCSGPSGPAFDFSLCGQRFFSGASGFNIAPATALPTTMPISFYAVAIGPTTGTNRSLIGGSSGSAQLRQGAVGGNFTLLRQQQAGIISSSGVVAAGQPFIAGFVAASTGTTISINGLRDTNGTNAAFSATTPSLCTTANNEWWDGVCFEFLAWSGRALTLYEQYLLEGHLAWKWNMVGQLYASHPFKSRAPGGQLSANGRGRPGQFFGGGPLTPGGGGFILPQRHLIRTTARLRG